MVEIEVRRTDVLGQPTDFGPDGIKIGTVKRSKAFSQVPESAYTKANIHITEVDKRYIARRKILIWLGKEESGTTVGHRLGILIKPMREEEAHRECEIIQEMLGFGRIKLFKNKYLLFILDKYQEHFLKMMQNYLSDREDVSKALKWLHSQKMVYRKGSIELGKFDQEYKILF